MLDRGNVEGTRNVVPRRRGRGRAARRLHLLGRDDRRGGGHRRHRGLAAPGRLPVALRALQARGRAGRAGSGAPRRGAGGVNPASVQGPGRGRGTAKILIDALNGRLRLVVDSRLSVVDVADCAEGHVLAEARGVPGERYLLSGVTLTVREAIGLLGAIAGTEEQPRPCRRPWR